MTFPTLVDGAECVYCGLIAEGWDHVLPASRGGTETLDNLVPACRDCNSSKSNRTPDEWLAGVSPSILAGRPKRPAGRHSIYLPTATWVALEALAENEDRSVGSIVRRAIAAYIAGGMSTPPDDRATLLDRVRNHKPGAWPPEGETVKET